MLSPDFASEVMVVKTERSCWTKETLRMETIRPGGYIRRGERRRGRYLEYLPGSRFTNWTNISAVHWTGENERGPYLGGRCLQSGLR